MSEIRITKEFGFETAHALYGYDGKCKNIHGHSYKLSVTLIGTPITDSSNPKYGMVLDFGDLKKIVKSEIVDVFDHATIFNSDSPHAEIGEFLQEKGHHILMVNYQPSTENMILDFVEKIKRLLPDHLELHSLKLRETDTSYAEWYASDN